MALYPTSESEFGPPLLNTLNFMSPLCAQNSLLMLDEAGEYCHLSDSTKGLDSEDVGISPNSELKTTDPTLVTVAGLPCHTRVSKLDLFFLCYHFHM